MTSPLAAKMRPKTIKDVVGQKHLLYKGSPLNRLAKGESNSSVILYGPPGTGKTTLAKVIASSSNKNIISVSGVSSGVEALRSAINKAQKVKDKETILFIDEIHRFNKAQQDVLLHAVEDGDVILIGATTENPSFSVIAPLISRSLVLPLEPLTEDDLKTIIDRALELYPNTKITDGAKNTLVKLSNGDARRTLVHLEELIGVVSNGNYKPEDTKIIDENIIAKTIDKAVAAYDKNGDQHYDIVSAFIKSMRGSDPDAAIHWLARLIESGEDPRFIARRLVVHASEDVGLAAPDVLSQAVAAAQAVQLIGMPEARINLAQATLAITLAPKSNAVITAIDSALLDVKNGNTGCVPNHLKDAHYAGAKALGNGVGYLYPHDYPYNIVEQSYLPEAIEGTQYYYPTDNAFEAQLTKRIETKNDILNRRKTND